MNYTIIIPHKNLPKLLKRALDSIPIRNDIQTIVIDDNSGQNIQYELNSLKSNFNNLEFIFLNENKGAGYARNRGLEIAIAEWVIFLDCDDFFTPDAFNFFDEYLGKEFDLVYFMMDSCFSDSLIKADRHLLYSKTLQNFLNDRIAYEDDLRYCMSGPVSKIIKYDIIKNNNVFFDEIIASNDIMFSAKIGFFAKNVAADSRTVYMATVRKGSLTKTRSRSIQFCRYDVQIRYNLFMKSIGKPNIQKHVTSRLFDALIYFGPFEFFKYIRLASKNKVNIFSGFKHFNSSFKPWVIRKLKKDRYMENRN